MSKPFFSGNLLGILGILTVLLVCSCAGTPPNADPEYLVTTIPAGKGPGSVETADLNGDGLPDLVIASTKDSAIVVLLGDGKGKFTPAPGSPFFSNRFPNDIVIADFNGDAYADIAIANTEASFLTVLLGNGKGQFLQSAGSPFAVHSRPHTHGIAAGDFDGDGNLDLVTDSWGEDKVVVLFGNGKGNFGNEASYKVGRRPYQRVRVADINHDGLSDIVTTNLESNNSTVLLGTGKGKFREAPGSPFPAGDAPFAVAIGDVNADGFPDLAIADAPTITSESKGHDGLSILLGDGTGNFTPMEKNPFKTGKSPSRIAIGDLNGDGVNDIVVTNYNDRSITIFYMSRKRVAGTITLPVGTYPDGIAIRDLNGDGKNDIVISNFDDDNLTILFRK
jgi:FG-GAP-like repeat